MSGPSRCSELQVADVHNLASLSQLSIRGHPATICCFSQMQAEDAGFSDLTSRLKMLALQILQAG